MATAAAVPLRRHRVDPGLPGGRHVPAVLPGQMVVLSRGPSNHHRRRRRCLRPGLHPHADRWPARLPVCLQTPLHPPMVCPRQRQNAGECRRIRVQLPAELCAEPHTHTYTHSALELFHRRSAAVHRAATAAEHPEAAGHHRLRDNGERPPPTPTRSPEHLPTLPLLAGLVHMHVRLFRQTLWPRHRHFCCPATNMTATNETPGSDRGGSGGGDGL